MMIDTIEFGNASSMFVGVMPHLPQSDSLHSFSDHGAFTPDGRDLPGSSDVNHDGTQFRTSLEVVPSVDVRLERDATQSLRCTPEWILDHAPQIPRRITTTASVDGSCDDSFDGSGLGSFGESASGPQHDQHPGEPKLESDSRFVERNNSPPVTHHPRLPSAGLGKLDEHGESTNEALHDQKLETPKLESDFRFAPCISQLKRSASMQATYHPRGAFKITTSLDERGGHLGQWLHEDSPMNLSGDGDSRFQSCGSGRQRSASLPVDISHQPPVPCKRSISHDRLPNDEEDSQHGELPTKPALKGADQLQSGSDLRFQSGGNGRQRSASLPVDVSHQPPVPCKRSISHDSLPNDEEDSQHGELPKKSALKGADRLQSGSDLRFQSCGSGRQRSASLPVDISHQPPVLCKRSISHDSLPNDEEDSQHRELPKKSALKGADRLRSGGGGVQRSTSMQVTHLPRVPVKRTTSMEDLASQGRFQQCVSRHSDVLPQLPRRLSKSSLNEDADATSVTQEETEVGTFSNESAPEAAEAEKGDDSTCASEVQDDAESVVSALTEVTSMDFVDAYSYESEFSIDEKVASAQQPSADGDDAASVNSDISDFIPYNPVQSPTPRIAAPSSALWKIAAKFRNGIVVGNHKYHFKRYDQTFIGSRAVDYMVKNKMANTREDAVFLGQRLVKELNLFHHVSWDHTFKDSYLFYKYSDESMLTGGGPASASSTESVQGGSTDQSVQGSSLPASDHSTTSTLRSGTLDLMAVARTFRRLVFVGTHKFRFKRYKDTFVGRKAVDVMVENKLAATRTEAVFIGQRLMEELNLFNHVCFDHAFKDEYLFFRFSDKAPIEPQVLPKDTISVPTESHRGDLSQNGNISGSQTSGSGLSRSETPGSLSWTSVPPVGSISAPSVRNSGLPPRRALVSFDSVHTRIYERVLDTHPNTSSGPSVGIGWNYIEEQPKKLGLQDPKKPAQVGILSRGFREALLKDLGYSTSDINRAVRMNSRVRQQRRSTLNKLTSRAMSNNAPPPQSSSDSGSNSGRKRVGGLLRIRKSK